MLTPDFTRLQLNLFWSALTLGAAIHAGCASKSTAEGSKMGRLQTELNAKTALTRLLEDRWATKGECPSDVASLRLRDEPLAAYEAYDEKGSPRLARLTAGDLTLRLLKRDRDGCVFEYRMFGGDAERAIVGKVN